MTFPFPRSQRDASESAAFFSTKRITLISVAIAFAYVAGHALGGSIAHFLNGAI